MSTDAKRDLEKAVGRGFTLDLGRPQPTPQPTRSLRKSAVLILFSVLSRHGLSAGQSVRVSELSVLLTQRASGLRHHAGQIAFPGGGVEPADDGVEAAALRETAEETGINIGGVEVLGTLPEISLAVSSNLVTPVVGWLEEPGETSADTYETTEVWQVPIAQLLDPEARGTSVLDFEGRIHRGPAFRFQDAGREHVVWGFTGTLLSALFDQAGWTTPWDESRLIRVFP